MGTRTATHVYLLYAALSVLKSFYTMFPALARAGVATAAATLEQVYAPAAEEMLGWVKPRDIVTIYEDIGRPDLVGGGGGQATTLSDVYRMPAASDDGADMYGKSTAVGSIVRRESRGAGQHQNRGHAAPLLSDSDFLSVSNL